MKKVVAMVLSVILLVSGLTGCGSGDELSQGQFTDEILTTTAVDSEKTMVTVRVEFGAGQEGDLEEVLEKKFPNVDIVLRHDGSTDSVYTARANLEAGVECDLILSRRLPVVAEAADKYLLDLSSEDFVNNYYMSATDSCTDEQGKVYFLPGPSDVYGLVYDRTMFDEYGWELPKSYSEFVKLLKKIKKEGKVVPLQASLMYPDMFQVLFNTYGYEAAFSGTDNYKWLSAYQNGKGNLADHVKPAVERFRQLFTDGILSISDMDVTPSDRSSMMYTDHSTAMIIECQNAVTYADEAQNDHSIAMMPFWTSDEEDSDYLYLIPSYYMGINKASAEESDEKKQLLLDIYSYLSSVEGQKALIGENFQISNVTGVPVEENEFSKDIISTIERGNTINTFYLAAGETNKQVERQLLTTAKDMLEDKLSVEDWLSVADETRDAFLSGESEKQESYGTVDETLTRLETAYTMADMYRTLAGTQIGICRGGGWEKSTNGYFYKGDITDSLLACLTPNKEPAADATDSMDEKIVVSNLTGSQILSVLNNGENWATTKGLSPYYVASGLTVEFNPWASDGDRVLSCKLADGSELESDKTYSVAYFAGSLSDKSIQPESALDATWQDEFLQWLSDQGGKVKKPEMTLTLKYEE